MEIAKWCQPHWDALRTAVEQRGLAHLISRGAAAAAAMVADELRLGSRRDAEGFDPLIRAWGMISRRGLEMGARISECPLCFVQRHLDECFEPTCDRSTPTEWIDGATDSLLAYARKLGLVISP